MIDKRNDFLRLLSDLCYTYKDYVRDNDGSKIDVVIDKNIIKMYLYNNKEEIDKFIEVMKGNKDIFKVII